MLRRTEIFIGNSKSYSLSFTLRRIEVAIFRKKPPIYHIHWNFSEYFIMVDQDGNVITTSNFRNSTELHGRETAIRTLRTLNNLVAQDKGHAEIALQKELRIRFRDQTPNSSDEEE